MGESIQEQQKRRPQAWEIAGGLTEPQIWQAFAWARSLGYRKAAELIAKEFNIAAPSPAAMCEFYDYYGIQERSATIHRAAADAASIRALAQGHGPLNDALAATLEQEASSAILAGNDPDRMRLLVGLALKARQAVNSERSLELEIQKYRDNVKSAVERGLDALAEEIKGNADAMAIYARFRAAVSEQVDRGLATAEKAA